MQRLGAPLGADVPPALADLVVHHVRRLGVSLEALEEILASLDRTEAFIVAAEDGWGVAYAACVEGRPGLIVEGGHAACPSACPMPPESASDPVGPELGCPGDDANPDAAPVPCP